MVLWKSISKLVSYKSNISSLSANTNLSDRNIEYAQKLEKRMERAAKGFTKKSDYEDLLIAMFAFGVSVAHCDGDFHEQEEKDIKEFLEIMSSSKLPAKIKKTIKKIYDKPPTFDECIQYIKHIPNYNWDIIEDVIDHIRDSDDVISEEERKYKISWNKFKADARKSA